jgi:Fur family ferric uptake transcriptional regulator
MSMRKLREETEFFHSYIRQCKPPKKKTRQKDLILETFLNTEGHLSIEDIYELVKKRDKTIGIVTVFRTLRLLVECGIANKVTLEDGLTRFEHGFHHPHHHHIVCTKCQKTIEYVCPELERIQNEIIQKYNFQPERHLFQTYGVCEDCLEKRDVEEIQEYDTERIFARDALKMVLYMEKRCLEFYRDSAERNQDPGGTKLLERMIGEGQRHIEELNTRLNEIIGQEENLELAPLFLHFDPCELEALLPDLSKYESAGEVRMDEKASTELVVSLNRRVAEFFKAYAEKFAETQGKQVFLNFAHNEEAHVDFIRKSPNGNSGVSGV